MSILVSGRRASNKTRNAIANATLEVAAILNSSGRQYYNSSIGEQTIGMEGLNDQEFSTLDRTKASLIAELKTTSLATEVLKGCSEHQLNIALESAATTILGAGAGASYYSASQKTLDNSGVIAATPMGASSQYAMESFDPATIEKFLAATVVANAQSALAGSFEDAFFPQILVPAGEHGIDLSLTIPLIYSNTKRDVGGAVFDIKKTSIVQAILTPSVLESDATTIWPQSTSNTEPATLVLHSDVPTLTKVISGVDVTTRPVKFGAEVDIIGLSNTPGLIAQKIFDETDQLDSIMNLGTVYYKVTAVKGVTTVASVFAVDVSHQNGSLLTQVAAGKVQQFQTATTVNLPLNPASVPVNGDTQAAFTTQMEEILGVAPGTDFNINISMKLSAEADTESGYFLVNANNTAISALYDAAGTLSSLSVFTAVGVTITIAPLGYMPKLRRSNTNLRNNGTIIDNNTTVTYRYPVQLQAPISSQTAIGANNIVTIETLGTAARIRNSGNAVQVLATTESILIADNGIPAQYPMAGAKLVKPTYRHHTIDVATVVANMNSKDALENLRGHLTSVLTLMANELLIDSHYLAALEALDIGFDGYEIIVVADPSIASHIWESGDTRTLGDNRPYVITQSNNEFFLGKLYMSFRRKTRDDNMHPLDFGSMLVTPSLTFELPINRNNRTVNEVTTVPRVNSYATLPILGRLDVLNLATMYTTN